MLWFPKSRVKCIVKGERNTINFHRSTLMQIRCKTILMLQINEEWEKSDDQLRSHTHEYFAGLFSNNGQNFNSSPGRLLPVSNWQIKVSEEQDASLLKIVDMKELKDVVWATHPYKAPGPDGLQVNFYQTGLSWIEKSL